MSEWMDKDSYKRVLDEQKLNKLFNWIKIEGGCLINILTFFRLGFQQAHDEGGGFVQFNIGFYRFSITLQFGVDNRGI